MIDYVLLEFLFFCSDGVGRSTLIEQYCKSFPENYKTTLGFNIFVKHVKLKQGKEVTIRFWDPSEILFFKHFNQFIYRQANGGIARLCLTCSRKRSHHKKPQPLRIEASYSVLGATQRLLSI